MKKNILTVIIMAVSLINTVLTAVIVFSIVPTANKTNNLISKVAQIIDLELEAEGTENIAISDIYIYELPEALTINLKKTDKINHYVVLNVSLSINTLHEDATTIQNIVGSHSNEIAEIVTEEFSKYSIDEVNDSKETIKSNTLTRIQDHFNSDCIINVSFGNMVMQ